MAVIVTCYDGKIRHEPFASHREATHWAVWGHTCLAEHTFTEKAPGLLARIDPPECGCTDCLTGYSVPLDRATVLEVDRMLAGVYQNATGYKDEDFHVRETITITWPGGQVSEV